MNACTVCRHPRAESIDAELREPRANAARVARRYGLSEQAVRRHVRNGHVAPEPIAAAPRGFRSPEALAAAVWAEAEGSPAWRAAVAEFAAQFGMDAAPMEVHIREGHWMGHDDEEEPVA